MKMKCWFRPIIIARERERLLWCKKVSYIQMSAWYVKQQQQQWLSFFTILSHSFNRHLIKIFKILWKHQHQQQHHTVTLLWQMISFKSIISTKKSDLNEWRERNNKKNIQTNRFWESFESSTKEVKKGSKEVYVEVSLSLVLTMRSLRSIMC